MTLLPYPGPVPMNVAKDAKYSVVHAADGMHIQLRFTLNRKEQAILTTDRHEELVEIVNTVKQADGSAPGGVFYINEYFDVLVKAQDQCFYAGSYEQVLEFDFDGQIISPMRPPGVEPRGMRGRGPTWGFSTRSTQPAPTSSTSRRKERSPGEWSCRSSRTRPM